MLHKSPLLCLILSLSLASCDDLGNVVFVNILYRHGNRTITHPYPNDPYRNVSLWPTGWGQLIQEGMEAHYELGKWLRARYSALLPLEYSRDDIFIQSTDVDRTLMSAYSNLAGLYEPDPSKNWNPNIKWRPIPVHTTPETADVLSGKRSCPQYDHLMWTLLKSPEMEKILNDNKYLIDTLTSATGMPVKSLEDVNDIYNILFIEELFKFPLPSWTKSVYPEPMKKLADFSFTVQTYTPEMARLKSGPIIGEVMFHMDKKAKEKSKATRKAWIYSAHDTTVADILNSLNVFEISSPPFCSTVLIELREKNNEYFVTTYYKNASNVDPYLLVIPGCVALCPLDKFKEIVTPIIPLDWERECRLSLVQQMRDTSTGVSLLATLSVLACIFAIVIFHKIRKQPINKESIAYQSLSSEAT